MKIGVISDIHANIYALRAVWNALVMERGVDKMICLGDLTGYGASPLEVIEWIRQNNVATTLGASDARIAFDLSQLEHRQGVGDETLEWTKTLLGDEERSYLRSLKVSERQMTPVGRMRYFHGSPEDPEERVDLRGAPMFLDELMQKLNCTVILCGGTHIPMVRRTETGLFINPGSVGLSLNGEPGADCALLEFNDSQLEVELLKIPYDYHAAAFDIHTWGLPAVIADVIKTGSAKPQTA